uniref:Uncharacterized protein n=1 Tax=Rhizophora mucronata TaxID=61149 RepID=A0A2P2QL71_RHIMU
MVFLSSMHFTSVVPLELHTYMFFFLSPFGLITGVYVKICTGGWSRGESRHMDCRSFPLYRWSVNKRFFGFIQCLSTIIKKGFCAMVTPGRGISFIIY